MCTLISVDKCISQVLRTQLISSGIEAIKLGSGVVLDCIDS